MKVIRIVSNIAEAEYETVVVLCLHLFKVDSEIEPYNWLGQQDLKKSTGIHLKRGNSKLIIKYGA